MGHQLGLDQLPCGRCGLMMQGPQAFPDMWLYHRSQSSGPPGHIYRKIRPTQRQRNQQPQTRGRKDTVKRSNCGAGHCSNDVCLFQPTLLCHFQRLGVWRCGTPRPLQSTQTAPAAKAEPPPIPEQGGDGRLNRARVGWTRADRSSPLGITTHI